MSSDELKQKDIQNLGFIPTKREMDLYKKEKEHMYKGTFYVCLAYGIIAIILLLAGTFTETGREFIFNKMLPATATFTLGALFIILYLTMVMYDIKPQQLKTKLDSDSHVICPDYWKLTRVNDNERQVLLENNNIMDPGKNFKEISTIENPKIQYKCELDPNIIEKSKMVDNNYLYETPRYINGYKQNIPIESRLDTNPNYVYVEKGDKTYNDTNIMKYAELTGNYNINGEKLVGKAGDDLATQYATRNPLICSEVYPSILEDMDSTTIEKNKYRCLYAKACDIPWTSIGCEYTPQK
jgi:hypothetical protein